MFTGVPASMEPKKMSCSKHGSIQTLLSLTRPLTTRFAQVLQTSPRRMHVSTTLSLRMLLLRTGASALSSIALKTTLGIASSQRALPRVRGASLHFRLRFLDLFLRPYRPAKRLSDWEIKFATGIGKLNECVRY